jgi:hypothetical protein
MSSQPYATYSFFSVRLNKKYFGQFTYRNPVRYPLFIAQFCVTYCTNRALFSHSGVAGYTRWYISERGSFIGYHRVLYRLHYLGSSPGNSVSISRHNSGYCLLNWLWSQVISISPLKTIKKILKNSYTIVEIPC